MVEFPGGLVDFLKPQRSSKRRQRQRRSGRQPRALAQRLAAPRPASGRPTPRLPRTLRRLQENRRRMAAAQPLSATRPAAHPAPRLTTTSPACWHPGCREARPATQTRTQREIQETLADALALPDLEWVLQSAVEKRRQELMVERQRMCRQMEAQESGQSAEWLRGIDDLSSGSFDLMALTVVYPR